MRHIMCMAGVLLAALACLGAGGGAETQLIDGDAATTAALQADDACGPDEASCVTELLQLRASRSSDEGALDETEAVSSQQRSAGEYATSDSEFVEQGASTRRNIKVVYHQTSAGAGHSILRSGFRLGTHHAICGSAIYFSPSVHDTDVKAMGGRGYIIQATVDLGRVRWMPRDCDPHMTGSRLKQGGFDSISLDRGYYQECIHLPRCREYVIYNPRQVISMKGFIYHGWKHWYSKYTGSSDLPSQNSSAQTAVPSPGDDDLTVEQLLVAGVLEPDTAFDAGGAAAEVAPEVPASS